MPEMTLLRKTEALEAIMNVIKPYLGENIARAAINVHCQKLAITDFWLSPEQLEHLTKMIGFGLDIFVGRDKSGMLVSEMRQAALKQGGMR
ncbi:MAG: hypothetical protein MUF51_05830 [Vicinamibacteria bacterium]|jgi:hypothetical protein|nr:hypothetical protein [Vicinamibacteria bacterium]